ncbi:MAG: rRNA ((1518)-N(6)/adenine(1519)-N(6))-dimethyltransferase, partial [Bacteroidota bacterium]
HLLEIDSESVEYLKANFKEFPKENIHGVDFLRFPLEKITQGEPFAIVGNFPYNISSQIFFKVLEHKNECLEVVGMLQKEVAERLASKPGNKSYGILSVLLQAYYEIEYLFSLGPEVFNPPPKVNSGVIRLKRIKDKELNCDPKRFKMIVKLGFNQRRKTLRNALKSLGLPDHPLLNQRAETLSVDDFAELANLQTNC